MGNIVDNKQSAEIIIFVDQFGVNPLTGIKICEPDSALPIILVDAAGNAV